MKTGNNKRTFLLLGVLVLLIIFWFYTRQESATTADDFVDTSSSASAEAAAILLEKARVIKLDTSVLESPAFRSLIDRSLPLLNLPVGRDNPFAPAP